MTATTSREGARRRALPAICLMLGLAFWPACGIGADPRGVPLTHTFHSPEAAATAVVNALAAMDLDALRALPLSEHEFRTVVWPELPSSRPEVNLPVEYAWGTLNQNSLASLSSTFGAEAGRVYTVVRVDFKGETTRYSTFAVHREAHVVVRGAAGTEQRVALFGSLLERDGQYKIFSYVTD